MSNIKSSIGELISQCKSVLSKKPIFGLATILQKYQPFTSSEKCCIQKEAVSFVGDLPSCAGNEYNQYRVEFKTPRPREEEVKNLLYTPGGMGWLKGTLYEKYSLQAPALKDLLNQPNLKDAIAISEGTVVQVQTPFTYGDWVSEHLMCLASAMPLRAPLLLPKHLMDKSYVRRDLKKMGIEAIAVERPVLIRRAIVVHKTRPSHYVTHQEVEAFRRTFRLQPVQPRQGSILYLSRLGVKSESPATQGQNDRTFPCEMAIEVMQAMGAKIVYTKSTTFEEYCGLASEAETVVVDFGASLFNLLMWNTKKVIVLFTDDWWDGFFLFLSQALGIDHRILIRVDNITRAELRHQLLAHLPQANRSLLNSSL